MFHHESANFAGVRRLTGHKRGGVMAPDNRPKADFSDVEGGSSSTAPSPSVGVGRTYTIKKGDSLSKIAKREYGDAQQWRRIYEANRDTIKDPDLIYPGQVVRIPDA
jgi:nucleoid-associated protein YgaU